MEPVKPSRLSRKKGIALWVLFHAVVLALGLCAAPWTVDSNLYSVLPASDNLKDVGEAEALLSGRTMNHLTLLFGHSDFAVAKGAADEFHAALQGHPQLSKVDYGVSEKSMDQARAFAHQYRYTLQNEKFVEKVREGGGAFLKQNALEKVYGGFSMACLDRIDEDPFLLSGQVFEDMMKDLSFMSRNVAVEDGQLVVRDSSKVYVMWSADLMGGSISDGSTSALYAIHEKIDALKKADPGLVVVTSGVPFHSYESASKAKAEVAIISGISIALVVLLILAVYRSPAPLLLTLFSISMAVVTALSVTWTLFGSIHVFTFVFGTSVIGVSIDYAIHFFTSWKLARAGQGHDGFQVRSLILKGLLLGFMTTELSYLALTFAPFPLLRQMAVFSAAGLLSSVLTITLLFAALPKTSKPALAQVPLKVVDLLLGSCRKAFGVSGAKKWVILTIALLVMAVGISQVQWGTDLRSLYSMSPALLESEKRAMELLDFGSTGSYFIVKGNSAEEVLQNEETFCKKMQQAESEGVVGNYLALSRYIPSREVQEKRFAEISAALDSTTVAEMLQSLGMTSDSAFRASLAEQPKFITPEGELPESLGKLLNSLWIGKVGDRYYSAVLPLHVPDASRLQELAKGLDAVTYVNKVGQINDSLTRLSWIAVVLVAVAYALVFIVLLVVYGPLGAFTVMRIPVASCLAMVAVLGYLGIPFNFFATVGLVLTLGIGIDYSLFFKERGVQSGTALAISLSAATTILSFGSLAFSGFVPVSTFGLAVFLGILCNFLLSFSIIVPKNKEIL